MIGPMLNTSLSLVRPAFSADGAGGRTAELVAVADVRALVAQPTAEERVLAERAGARLDHVVYVPFGTDVRRDDEFQSEGTSSSSVIVGDNTIGGDAVAFPDGFKAASQFLIDGAGSVQDFQVYMDGNGGGGGLSQKFKAIIYGDQADAPGALLYTSQETIVDAGDAAAWVPFTFADTPLLTSGAYWLGIIGGGTDQVARIYRQSSGNNYNVLGDAYGDGASNPWGSGTSVNAQLSVYLTALVTTSSTNRLRVLSVVNDSRETYKRLECAIVQAGG